MEWSGITISSDSEEIAKELWENIKMTHIAERGAERRMHTPIYKSLHAPEHTRASLVPPIDVLVHSNDCHV